ncbi:Alpha-D-glucose-1-phosphate phosphatase YihX [Gimesia panareensis]|uniref:Alpha-D-glucose-1-phosphate phosphatase YihX n=1 Tax=Gimesia panareensis TaxID=2527978 RepID=A0A518FKH2_9PLAN|nr:HAD family phosphatase [Gimesia panareensis]QDV16848.1 Alpha-D-glucose-1-phosphate phosphatase YihX [Gimesia panareensis]
MIRTFLFDMGNVLAFFSHDRMCEQMGALCGRSREEIQSLLIDSGKQWEFERGQLSSEEFHQWFEEAVGQSVSFEELVRAGSDIFELNASIVPVLDRLKDRGHRLVLLSNTCISHFDFIWNEYDVLQRFDDFATSYKAGAIKPEPAIFDYALEKIQCAPEEAFYTDDIPHYVDVARGLGIQAEVFTDTPSLIQHLSARGIEV